MRESKQTASAPWTVVFRMIVLGAVICNPPLDAWGADGHQRLLERNPETRIQTAPSPPEVARELAQARMLLEQARRRSETDPDELAMALHRLARSYRAAGLSALAELALHDVLALQDDHAGSVAVPRGIVLHEIALTAQDQGRFADAVQHYQAALISLEKTHGVWHAHFGRVLGNLAISLRILGRYREAVAAAQRSKTILQAALGENSVEVWAVVDILGSIFLADGQWEESRGAFALALAGRQASVGQRDPLIGISASNLAQVHLALGNTSKAALFATVAIELLASAPGRQSLIYAKALDDLASVLALQGQCAEAGQLHQQALDIRIMQLGADHIDVASSWIKLALLAQQSRNLEEAHALLERAHARIERQLGITHPDSADVQMHLARNHALLGHRAKARTIGARALRLLSERLGPRHVRTIMASTALERALSDPSTGRRCDGSR